MIRIAINGYGRIGRSVLRALYESRNRHATDRRLMQVVAINEPADLSTIAHLTKYDSTHGRFGYDVQVEGSSLKIAGDLIAVSHHNTLDLLFWDDVDVVLECSGCYPQHSELSRHLNNGARRVLLSQPGDTDLKTIIYGVNHSILEGSDYIVSAASCTSNCIVPVIATLDDAFGIESGVITTIHSLMNDQPVLDGYHHTDLRKTRSASASIIPVDTGLAAGIERILPGLGNRFSARALRVPTHNVSAMELAVQLRQIIDKDSVNSALRAAAHGGLANILGYSVEPLASIDYNHDARSGIVDGGETRVSGQLASVLTWFDNEWAYANRMLDIVSHWTGL